MLHLALHYNETTLLLHVDVQTLNAVYAHTLAHDPQELLCFLLNVILLMIQFEEPVTSLEARR